MGDVELAASAKRNLEDIEDWMGQSNPSRAVSFIVGLVHALDGLADMPLMGRARPEVRAGPRSIVHKPHVVFQARLRALAHATLLNFTRKRGRIAWENPRNPA